MGEAILLTLWVGTTIFLGCKIENDRKNRESHEWWLSEVKDCIRSIEHEFRHHCEKILDEEFSRQKFNDHNYFVRIKELEEKYKNELTEKVIARKRVRITTVPGHLAKEYEENLSNITDTFLYFAGLIKSKDI